MARYIDADYAIRMIENDSTSQVYYTKKDAIECIECVPTADVQEVKHGKWTTGQEPSGSRYAHCSACNRKMNDYCYGYAHCPLCGAKMDKE